MAVEQKEKSRGRRKIPMKKIENAISRQVTFSKRRKGLFHKAAQLCQLTGAVVGIIVPSIGRPNNTYTFGHPDIESVINNYQNNTPMSFQFSGNELELMQRHDILNKQNKEARKKVKFMKEMGEKLLNNENHWWNEEIEDLGLEELHQFSAALEELSKKVLNRADELVASASGSAMAEAQGTRSCSAVVMDPMDDLRSYSAVVTDPMDDLRSCSAVVTDPMDDLRSCSAVVMDPMDDLRSCSAVVDDFDDLILMDRYEDFFLDLD